MSLTQTAFDLESTSQSTCDTPLVEGFCHPLYLAKIEFIESKFDKSHRGVGAESISPVFLFTDENSDGANALFPVDPEADIANWQAIDLNDKSNECAFLRTYAIQPISLILLIGRHGSGNVFPYLRIIDPFHEMRDVIFRVRAEGDFLPLQEYNVIMGWNYYRFLFHMLYLYVVNQCTALPESSVRLFEGTRNENPDFHSVGIGLGILVK